MTSGVMPPPQSFMKRVDMGLKETGMAALDASSGSQISYSILSEQFLLFSARDKLNNISIQDKLNSMAGRSQDKKGESSSRSKKSALPDPENPQSSRQGSQPSRTSQSKPSKNTSKKEKFPETSSSTSSEVAVESKTSAARGQTDLLWIITDQPSDFKNPDIRQKISRHVMRDYLKDQGSKESKSQRRKNPSHSSHSDEDLVVSGSTSHLPLMPSVERSGRSTNITPTTLSSDPKANQTPALFHEMYYPLSVDLDSFEFRQRLGQLIYRHLSVWYQKQASRLCGNDNYLAWEEWIPEILENDSLLYAQAFAAVNHINFMNPKAYKPERYALKEHAIQKINNKINDPEAAASDANIGAVLCLASALHLENQGAKDYTIHMRGLQHMVAMRGGLQGLHTNPMLHDALHVCDILGMMIFRTELALSADIREETSQLQENSFSGILESPLYSESTSSHPAYPELPAHTVQVLHAMSELTSIFQETGPNASLSTSSKRLYHCLESGSPGKGPTYEACRLAGLIYFRALYHNIPFSSSENTGLMQALQTSLETIFVDGWNGVPGVLLWALLIGTAAERSNSADAFLAGHLSITCLSLVTLGHDVSEILKRFLWLEKAVEEKASRLSR